MVFRLFWRFRSRAKNPGSPKIDAELRTLIRRIVQENPTWGAPRIHGEIPKLGFNVSERAVSRYAHRLSPNDQKRKLWAGFLRNNREIIAAMDFFIAPTLTFRVLYCFFVIEHSGRKILHFNVTEHPTSTWIMQQLQEAFPDCSPYRYAILDRDAKSSADVMDLLKASGIKPKRTSPSSPWQNGITERWIGSRRRELLDDVIVIGDTHLHRLMREYISYYHADRIHDSLEKDSPATRFVACKPTPTAHLVSSPRIGGLHHRYDWQQAA